MYTFNCEINDKLHQRKYFQVLLINKFKILLFLLTVSITCRHANGRRLLTISYVEPLGNPNCRLRLTNYIFGIQTHEIWIR